MTVTAAKLAVEIDADTTKSSAGLKRASRDVGDFARDTDGHLVRAGGSYDRFAAHASGSFSGVSSSGNTMIGTLSSGLMAFAGGAAVGGAIQAIGAIGGALVDIGKIAAGVTLDLAQSAMQWETAFTTVSKTVSGTPAELDTLNLALRALARRMPVSHEDLAKIASTAGQLGVPTSQIATFTEQIAMLATATDLTADEAATSLGRFANIMGTPIAQIGNVGAALVELGNNGASTESEIMDMGLRLAAAGKQAGMSEGQVLGLASALSSVGIDAEAGGTAFSRVIVGMNQAVIEGGDKLDKFAQVSGMSVRQFVDMWKRNPTQALDAFLKGLNKISQAGGDVDAVLNGLDFNDIRVTDALKRASSAANMFDQSIKTGQEAMTAGTAARDEYAKFADTTASKIEILKNQWEDFKISLGQAILNWAKPYIDQFMAIGNTIGEALANGDNFNEMLGRIAAEHGNDVAAMLEKIIGVVQIAGAYFWGFLGIIRVTMGAAIYPIALLGEAFLNVMDIVMVGFQKLAHLVASVLDAIGAHGLADQLRAAGDEVRGLGDELAQASTWARQVAGAQVSDGLNMIGQAARLGAEGMRHYSGEVTRSQGPISEMGRRVAGLAGEIFNLPKDRPVTIRAETEAAARAVWDVAHMVGGIPDRTVTIYVRAVNEVGNSISNAVAAAIGHRASGGHVQAGGLYVVGEKGPELVRFGAAGYVTPNDRSRQVIGSAATGGGAPVQAGPSSVTVVLEVDRRRLGEVTIDALNLYRGESTARLKVS